MANLGLDSCLFLPFDPDILLGWGSLCFGLHSFFLDVSLNHVLCDVCSKYFMIIIKDYWLYFKYVPPWLDRLVKGMTPLGLDLCLLLPFDPRVPLGCGWSNFWSCAFPFGVKAIHFLYILCSKFFMTNTTNIWMYVKSEQP